MTPRDHIDREIVRLHAEGCPRSWIGSELGLGNTALYERCRRLRLDFRAHSHRAAVLCPKGHNARVLGHRGGRCVTCGGVIVVPPGLVAAADGTIRFDASAVRRAPEPVREREVDVDAVLALEVERESTPRYLQAPIEEQLRRLRA